MLPTLYASSFSTMWQTWSWKREGHGDGNDQAFSKYSKQQVCNVFTISLKDAMDGVHFRVNQDPNFYKLDDWFLIKVARHVQSNQKRKLLKFCNILRKSIAAAFVFCCDVKHSDTLLGCRHLCCHLFLGVCDQKWAWLYLKGLNW